MPSKEDCQKKLTAKDKKIKKKNFRKKILNRYFYQMIVK